MDFLFRLGLARKKPIGGRQCKQRQNALHYDEEEFENSAPRGRSVTGLALAKWVTDEQPFPLYRVAMRAYRNPKRKG